MKDVKFNLLTLKTQQQKTNKNANFSPEPFHGQTARSADVDRASCKSQSIEYKPTARTAFTKKKNPNQFKKLKTLVLKLMTSFQPRALKQARQKTRQTCEKVIVYQVDNKSKGKEIH